MKIRLNISLVIIIVSLMSACSGLTGEPGILDPGTADKLEQAQVVRVIDGDTLELLISGNNHRVRLFGVDTPERGEKCFKEATKRTRELSGQVVRVEAGPRTEDRYGRLLLYLFTSSGESIDSQLIEEGLATAWTRDGQYRDILVKEEQKARKNRAGCLWMGAK